MANIMSMTKLRNKVSRNGFDLSEKNIFTAKAGEAIPVSCIECIPGDSFEIDAAWFTRTQPVNTAAYTRMREYYDFYFVPTNLLWNKFNTFVTQMTDNNQKANGINGNVQLSDEHPYFTYDQIAQYVNDLSTMQAKNFFGYDRAELTCKLLHYLNYGNFYPFINSFPPTSVNAKLNPFPLLAYQKVYQDHIRDSQWERAYAPAANIDYISGASGSLNLPISEIDKQNENMFDLRYYNWNKDYFMGLLPNSQYGDAATILQPSSSSDDYEAPIFSQQLSLLDKVDLGHASAWNAASPNYRALRGDLPADGYIHTYYRNSSTPDNNSGVPASQVFTQASLVKLRQDLGISSDQSVTGAFTILALRQAEAKQRWQEITQSVQQDYKSQIQAHFGENVSDAYSDRSRYIGGVSGNLDIQPVTNQNLTGDNDAKIAGRGEGGSRGKIEFETKVHGYLLCIYHVTPILDYALDGIARQNLKTSVFDYAIPEFDATGMVSVPLVELTSSWLGTSEVTPNNSLLGYAPRYIDYKSRIDRVHGAFFNGGLENWVAPIDTNYVAEYLDSLGDAISTGAFNYHFFKIPPAVLDTIFGVASDSSVKTDQFLVNCAFDIKAVRNLDRNGLPY